MKVQASLFVNIRPMSNSFDIGKGFAHAAADLTDSEITETFKIITLVREKYAHASNSPENLDKLRDEVLTRLMEIGVLATLDPAPCFYGEPPIIEIIGKIQEDKVFHTEGFDHEKKQYEVRKSVDRNEDWLGQKESVNKLKRKK
jgi:hypothetical protein